MGTHVTGSDTRSCFSYCATWTTWHKRHSRMCMEPSVKLRHQCKRYEVNGIVKVRNRDYFETKRDATMVIKN